LGESSSIQSASVAKYARIQFKKGNFKYGSGETKITSKAVILIDAFVAVHESVFSPLRDLVRRSGMSEIGG
jgi:hypothetical protein